MNSGQSPKVWNRDLDQGAPPDAVYIGRGTPWGNPFIIGPNGTRDEVISQYKFWLQNQPALVERIKRDLKGKDLLCHCKPFACHGDLLLEIANPMNDEAQILAPFSPSNPTSMEQMIYALRYASEQYYNGRSVVSDIVYDALVERLRGLDPTHPFLAQVGAPPPKHRGECVHGCHMGSQHHISGDDAIQIFKHWMQKRSEEIFWSVKVDGSSVALRYEHGILNQALTRGDGSKGMDITANAVKWCGIPNKIPMGGTIYVRVEAMLPIPVWKEHFFDASEPTNPRNVGNGIICRAKDPDEANQYIVPYGLSISMENAPTKTMADMFRLMQDWGFAVPAHGSCQGYDHARHAFQQVMNDRDSMDLMIDGVVFSVLNLAEVERAGFTDNRPNGQVAVKFPTERKTTTISNIVLSMGHTGAIIPTAEFEPVFLAGTTVARALLNNFVYMENDLGGIGIGDTVEIEKGGDIIPHIVRVVERVGGLYHKPSECPWCNTHLVEDGRRLKCPNDDCDGKVLKQIKNWITKTGIKELGDVYLQALIDKGIVSRIPDLYNLSLSNLQGVATGEDRNLGMKRATTILNEINKTRTLGCDVFMSALGITNLGLERAQKSGYKKIEEWCSASSNELQGIFGDNLGIQIHASIQRKQSLIRDLLTLIEVLPYYSVEAKGDALAGVGICFSTVRATKEEKAFIESQGGEVQSGVSAKTKMLVVKDPEASTAKTQQAKKAGVPIISYDHFQTVISKFEGQS